MEKGIKYSFKLAITIIVAVQWLACKQTPNHTAAKPAKPNVALRTKQPQPQPAIKDTISVYTNDVYDKYIPSAVKTLLKEKLSGWKLPSPSSWEKYWFNEYKKDSSLVDYVTGDFNGDRKPDYALLLVNEQHAFVVWVLQSDSNDNYQAIQLTELTEASLPLETGLELIDAGKLNYLSMETESNEIKAIDLKHQAIQISFFEASAETYYWDEGKFKSVTTGD